MRLADPLPVKFRPDQMTALRKEAEKDPEPNMSRLLRRIVDKHFGLKPPKAASA